MLVVGKLPHGSDLMAELTAVAVQSDVKAGMVQVIGALQRATVGFYDQWGKRYRELIFGHPLEIVAGMGNVSLRDGAPFVHLHLSLADEKGSVIGGHAMTGCTVFAAEYLILPLPGIELRRAYDDTTGLHLWEQDRATPPGFAELPPEQQQTLLNP